MATVDFCWFQVPPQTQLVMLPAEDMLDAMEYYGGLGAMSRRPNMQPSILCAAAMLKRRPDLKFRALVGGWSMDRFCRAVAKEET
jgi:hypothetical protein